MPFDPNALFQQAQQLTGCPPGQIKDPSGKCVAVPSLPTLPPGILAELDKYTAGLAPKKESPESDSTAMWVLGGVLLAGVGYIGYKRGWFD